MSSSFDPYHQWLGIRDPERPPNHYRLLGIDLFESDRDVIVTAADRQMAHLRTFQHGPHAFHSQQLLNEVSAARVCLLDAENKARYDDQLRKLQPPELPPVSQGEVVDDRPSVVVAREAVSLRPPGRGPRSGGPWYVKTTFLLPLLVIVLGLVAVRLYRDYGVAHSTGDDQRLTDATSSAAEGRDDLADESGSSVEDATPSEDAGQQSEPSPSEFAEQNESTIPDPDLDASVAETAAVEPTSPTPTASDVTDSSDPPGWHPGALAITGTPAEFNVDHPTGAFLFALSQRDSAAADGALQALRVNPALGVTASSLQEATLIRDTLNQFWQAAEAAGAALQPQDTLTMRDVQVEVADRNEITVQLIAPTGQRESFELGHAQIHRDLAVALVEHYYAATPGAGWRLIATFLAVDHDGDVERAEYYAQRAELQGFAARFLTQLVRHLSGQPLATPPVTQPVTSTTEDVAPPDDAPEDDAISAVVDADGGVPSKSEQLQARREVLSPVIAEFREEKLAAEDVPAKLLQKAQDPQLGSAARYVLLDYALKRAKSRLDFDTALKIIDFGAEEFGQNRADMRYNLLQSTANRAKGGDRRRFAQFAKKLAAEAVARDDYDEAIRFASLAQSLGRPVPDRFFRQSLLSYRLEIDAIKKAYQQLVGETPSDEQATASPTAEISVDKRARFQFLSKGDFDGGLPAVQVEQDAALGSLVQQELAASKSVDDQLQLAREWSEFGRERTGLEMLNGLRRARYWYHQCLAGLDRANREEVQQDLDRIAEVIGRDSDQLDLTEVPPVGFRVGYGTFGINQNIDAATNPRVEPLPEVGGREVTRFLWASAPSRIEYLVPEGATQFRALGILNAASQDGVQFRVRADDQNLFTSPVIKVMGGQIPIQVNLPAGAKTLELIIDPLKNNNMDHTYWVRPQIIF